MPVSIGVSTFDTAAAVAEDETLEVDDARYSAEMIQEAMQNLHRPDKLSAYERRVALREVKDILKQLLDDTQATPSCMKVDQFLKQDESSDTVEQLVLLREEMLKLMRHAESMAGEVAELSRRLATVWGVCGHEPSDLLEVKIKYAPASIPACPLALNVLQGMLEVWGTSSSPSLEEFDGIDLTTLLDGCGVPEHMASAIVTSPALKTQAGARAMVARITGSLSELEALQHIVARLGRYPRTSIDQSVRSMADYSAREEWLRDAKALQLKVSQWELLSGIPFVSPLGPALYMGSGQQSKDSTFGDILKAAIRSMDEGV